ncbi:MAG TPA: signal recognition particle protein [candidate division Zixibacteria bacterium]|nr:signal recognition particle protein [candidate division Zixibacteria bacterium]MDD4917412.1 signal recognition particle protein [candidate division Zixibacteria bacterium]MDM7972970.1 signal recognition particle protein [candidate division Zixibacteria bacterium]HOD66926.1 signal recognition particle protein [candidate division Zixibacteria bacterium]HOZ07049.1 signal recognition particle protein [candidate division Zixibacteria bacterium]
MFSALSDKLEDVFKKLRGAGRLSEKNIRDAMREVRQALLEADVNYKVAKRFVAAVEAKAVGEEVLRSIEPGQQVIKIVHDELVLLLGGKAEPLAPLDRAPTIFMVCGLQGSGKTTLCGKIALWAKRKNKKPLVVAADIYRPAAVKQLRVLAESIQVPHFSLDGAAPPEICREALRHAERSFIDLVILDTAGRLHVDEEMMVELQQIKEQVRPHEILLVADAMTGQDAVNVAREFHDRLAITGVVLSKLDGDARGGAALSIREVTGTPIKLASVGEKLGDLEPFHPDRLASRILGMGDIVTLVERAQEHIDQAQAEKMQQKLLRAKFDFEDFLEQMEQIKKMGPLDSLLQMIPGVGKALKGVSVEPKEMERMAAIIKSMTIEERRNPGMIDGSRKKRIAAGSGNSVQTINQLLKQFTAMQKMFHNMNKGNLKGIPKGMLPFG